MRLFVAADLSPDQLAQLRQKVEEARQAAAFDFIRWIPEENWHATLAFIGDRDESELPRIEDVVSGCMPSPGSLMVEPHRIQGFPSRNQPRLLALKAEPSSAMSELYFQLGRVLKVKDASRQFRFHVTVARFRDQDEQSVVRLNEAIRDLTEIGGKWLIPKFTLYESTLKQSGASYTPLRTWPICAE